MKCAVLCNGPSRTDYVDATPYEFVIGCNIPWTKVDATVVLDESVIDYWYKNQSCIDVPVYFSRKAWMYADSIRKRPFFERYMIELVDTLPEYDSSGHQATRCCLRKGATEIDIYGCDSWFDQTIVSHTHQYVKNLNPDDSKKHVIGWRTRWTELMNSNPSVNFNFIRKYK